jgi:hypothetical protein
MIRIRNNRLIVIKFLGLADFIERNIVFSCQVSCFRGKTDPGSELHIIEKCTLQSIKTTLRHSSVCVWIYRFTPKTSQCVLFEFVCKKSLNSLELGHFKLKIRIILIELFSG